MQGAWAGVGPESGARTLLKERDIWEGMWREVSLRLGHCPKEGRGERLGAGASMQGQGPSGAEWLMERSAEGRPGPRGVGV